jgi:UDP-2,3-diacylglucosamine hydrolase
MAELSLGPTFIVSDLHLRGPDDENQKLFLRFLDERMVPHLDRTLVIAGDLFDFWYVVGDEIPEEYKEVIERLCALPRVLWLEGNHDIGQSLLLAERGGLQVLAGSLLLKCGSLRVHVCHGDQLDHRDLGQRLLRKMLGSRGVRALADRLGSQRVQSLGTKLASRSRGRQGGLAGRDRDWLGRAELDAQQRTVEATDLCVRGHGHFLGWWPSGLICLGDWLSFYSYLELQPAGKQVQLRRYVPGTNTDPLLSSSAVGELSFNELPAYPLEFAEHTS